LYENSIYSIIGLKTPIGIVQGLKPHFIEQMINRGVTKENVVEALTKPLHITEAKLNDRNEWSVQFIGEAATVAYNPETQIAVTAWITSALKRKKYSNGGRIQCA
jgi:hypothetical protein